MAAAADEADASLRHVRRAGELHRPRKARDAVPGPRPAVVPAGAGQGPQGPGAGGPDRAGVRAQAVREGRPLHRARRRHRLGERVGEHHRRRRIGARADAEPAAGDAGPERSPLPVRVGRDRRVHAAAVRPADRVPRPGAARHAARAAAVAGEDPDRPEGRAVRRDRRRDRQGRAGAGRPAGVRQEHARRGPRLARRHRRHRGHRVQQVGADDPADAPAGRVLQRAGRQRKDPAPDELRRPRARPARVAAVLQRADRQQRDPARRHDRRPEVHLAPVRRRLRPRGEAEEAAVPVALVAPVLDGRATWLRRSGPCPRPSSSRRGRPPCVQPSSAGSRRDGRS